MPTNDDPRKPAEVTYNEDVTFTGKVRSLGGLESPEIREAQVSSAATAVVAQQATAGLSTLIADMSDDNIITPSEKKELKRTWLAIVAEYPIIYNQALDRGLDPASLLFDEFTVAYEALEDTVDPIILDMTTNSTIVGTDFRAAWSVYYDARQSLMLDRITEGKPPTNNVTDLVITSEDNPTGGEDVTFEWKYIQGAVLADGFLVFAKRDITTPGAIEPDTDPAIMVLARNTTDQVTYTTTIRLPSRLKNSGNIIIHYRFGVAAYGVKRIGAALPAEPAATGGIVEDADWLDEQFADTIEFDEYNYWNFATGVLRAGTATKYIKVDPANGTLEVQSLDMRLTDSDLTTFSPDGTSVAHEGQEIVWRDTAGAEITRINSNGAPIVQPWGSSEIVTNEASENPRLIQQADGVLRVVFKLVADGKLYEQTKIGSAAWSAKALVLNEVASPLSIIQQSDGTIRLLLLLNSDGKLYEQTKIGSAAWSAKALVLDEAVYRAAIIQQSNGLMRAIITLGADQKLYEITKDGSAAWSAKALVLNEIVSDLAMIQQENGILLAIFQLGADQKLYEITKDGSAAWSAKSVTVDEITINPSLIQQSDKVIRLLFRQDVGTDYLYETLKINYGTWSAKSLVIGEPTRDSAMVQMQDGTIKALFRKAADNKNYSLTLELFSTLGAGIIERGSNSNGEYIKFSDGTVIWAERVTIASGDLLNKATVNYNIGTYGWSLYTSTGNVVNVPVELASTDYHVVMVADANCRITQLASRVATYFTMNVFHVANFTSDVSFISYGMGRWRA